MIIAVDVIEIEIGVDLADSTKSDAACLGKR